MFKKTDRMFFLVILVGLVLGAGLGFGEKARWSETVVLLVRKYELGGNLRLSFFWDHWWRIYDFVGKVICLPTFVKMIWWKKEVVFFFVCLPICLIFVEILSRIKSKIIIKILLLVIVLYWLPLSFWATTMANNFVTKTGFDWKLPWSADFVWMWGDKEDLSGQTYFEYKWEQKKVSKRAVIKISCLGHYQFLVNEKTVYRGPMFAVLPKVYYDEIDFGDYVRPGENKISIICEFLKEPVHEYQLYQEPGLLVGGWVNDGWKNHNLADWRLWKSNYLDGVQYDTRISADAGYAETIDLNQAKKSPGNCQKMAYSYEVFPRPLPLLKYEQKEIKPIGGQRWDLGRFMPGYLTLKVRARERCEVGVIWGAELKRNKSVEEYFNQKDVLIFPPGETTWEQFSRRAGRFVEIEENGCLKNIEFFFTGVTMPIDWPDPPSLTKRIDKQIYELSKKTLENNMQDHPEDCVEREKAMYLGDALAVAKCLTVDGENLDIVAEIIEQFADSQNPDGSFPSMTPSGVDQFIPSYALQWPILLELYLNKGGKVKFVRNQLPALKKLLTWARENESDDGFIYNKNGKELWWPFIDWTKTDDSLTFSTPLQVWYTAALQSSEKILERLSEDKGEIRVRQKKLQAALLKSAYITNLGVFADSFDKTGQSMPSLLTNALAGKFALFASDDHSRRAIDYFKTNLYSDSPFSQTWVVEWLMAVNKKDLALEIMRNYWGAMVEQGASSIFERYRVGGTKFDQGSYSHAWGCGPMSLYKELDF